MSVTVDQLPEDPVALKALLREKTDTIDQLRKQVGDLLESLRLERYRHYGTRSEKSPDQQELFDEADSDSIEESATQQIPSSDSATAAKPCRSTRKPLPADLPRVRQVHELENPNNTASVVVDWLRSVKTSVNS